jgi:hypothetical protein
LQRGEGNERGEDLEVDGGVESGRGEQGEFVENISIDLDGDVLVDMLVSHAGAGVKPLQSHHPFVSDHVEDHLGNGREGGRVT